MGEPIKNAFQRAWERAERIEVPREKLQELEHQPQGARLAAAYLKDDKFDLTKALADFTGPVRRHVVAGAQATFFSNIILPINKRNQRDTRKALEGLQLLKRDKSKLGQVVGRIESLLAQYERTRQQTYEALKKEFEGKQARPQALQLTPQGQVQVEMQPEFQMKWRELTSRLDMDYEARLSRLKAEVAHIV